MRKILFVIDSLTCGGAEKSLITLLNSLDYSKFDVDLMLFKRGGTFESMIPSQVKIIDAPFYFEQLQNRRKARMIDVYYRLKTSLLLRCNLFLGEKYHSEQIVYKSINKNIENNKQNYDCAIAYSQGMPTYYVAKHVNAERKIGWINCNYVATKYNKKLDQMFYKEMKFVVVVSNYIKESLHDYPFYNKLNVINDIVDPNMICRLSNNDSDYTNDMEFSGIKILTVARLEKIKGYDLLLKSASLLKEQGIKFKWYIIGEGNLRNEIETYCAENELENFVTLLGQKNNPYPYMKRCDIYVQTSRNEGLGLTVIEAGILEKLIVCTNFSTASSLIEDGKDGLLCEISPSDIASKIEKIITDKKIRGQIEENIKRKCKFDTTNEIQKVYKLLG